VQTEVFLHQLSFGDEEVARDLLSNCGNNGVKCLVELGRNLEGKEEAPGTFGGGEKVGQLGENTYAENWGMENHQTISPNPQIRSQTAQENPRKWKGEETM